jgi:hypothetical protein
MPASNKEHSHHYIAVYEWAYDKWVAGDFLRAALLPFALKPT